MLVDQYPDSLSFISEGTPAVYDDETGNWTPAVPGATISTDCRYEASSGNGWIPAADGTRTNYSGIIYMPLTAPIIKTGTTVTITEKREGIADNVFTDEVLRFHRGQLNARIWV